MVTGVEAAGFILAVLPLLREALSVYKRELEKTGVVLYFKQFEGRKAQTIVEGSKCVVTDTFY